MLSVSEQKKVMRREFVEKRRLYKQYNDYNNLKLNSNLFDFINNDYVKNTVVGCFWPLDNEPDLRPLIKKLYDNQYVVALPETTPKGSPLSFRIWTPNVMMEEGLYKTRHPKSEYIIPDVILVPLLAFDSKGNRLGYGGGYYDRTFADIPTVHKIGIAFAYQKVKTVPVAEFDYPLSVIVTDNRVLHIDKE